MPAHPSFGELSPAPCGPTTGGQGAAWPIPFAIGGSWEAATQEPKDCGVHHGHVSISLHGFPVG